MLTVKYQLKKTKTLHNIQHLLIFYIKIEVMLLLPDKKLKIIFSYNII